MSLLRDDLGMIFEKFHQFSTLVVLFNGCPTQEISIQRGLKQGGPLAPFLFLLVVEGLSGLISRVVEMHLLSSVRVGSPELVISHLQYAKDTIILEDANVDKFLIIKAILRGFELPLGLRVNFVKISLIGVNSDTRRGLFLLNTSGSLSELTPS